MDEPRKRGRKPGFKPAPGSIKPRSSTALTEKQTMFVYYLVHERLSQIAAARAAGISPSSAGGLAMMPKIKLAIAQAREEYREATKIRREDVVKGIMEGVNMGRTLSDPMAIISGWKEIGKLLGLYEPETRRLEVSGKVVHSIADLKALPDEELLKLAYEPVKSENSDVHDAEFTESPGSGEDECGEEGEDASEVGDDGSDDSPGPGSAGDGEEEVD